jgi:cell division protein FtsL
MLTKIKINLILWLAVVVLSSLNIIWHNESRNLHNELREVQTNNQRIVAINKQLLTQYSKQISGGEIQNRAELDLNMKLPEKQKTLTYD